MIIFIGKKNGRMADCVIIATQDKMHKDPAIAFANQVIYERWNKKLNSAPQNSRHRFFVIVLTSVSF